jgi:cytochrome oxidase Cu insertion factor (SCO1/SenC/PrrC family)
MPGEGEDLQLNDPTVVGAFHSALLHQLLFLAVVAAVLALAWNAGRALAQRRATASGTGTATARPEVLPPEPTGRRIVRIGFGVFWLFDGLLQLQASLPLGLPSRVVDPRASASPGWVQHLVASGLDTWVHHPVPAAAAAVWIEVGLGIGLLAAARGSWSRGFGLASAAWGLVVWVFGESFGGIFAPGLSWLAGAPGAAAFYLVAGVLIGLPGGAWSTRRLGAVVLRCLGALFVVLAVLQAWPGRGYWQGAPAHARSVGTLTGIVRSAAAVPQPRPVASAVTAFGSFDAAHGWAVNLFVVVALAGIGSALLSLRRRPVVAAVAAVVVVGLADWFLVEDFGFLGGTGTDPNSMVPMLVLLVGGAVAWARPSPAAAAGVPADAAAATRDAPAVPGRAVRLGSLPALVLAGAVAVVLTGAVPLAAAAVNPDTDATLTLAVNGTPDNIDAPAPGFTLVDQDNRTVSLADLRGRTVVVTFLDPVCTSDCPTIAQEMRVTDQGLGATGSHVAFVAIVANPVYRATSFTRAFDSQEGLAGVRNWYYLTGSVAALEEAWGAYGCAVEVSAAGAMVAHSDLTVVIDAHGDERAYVSSNPGNGDTESQSFITLLSDEIHRVTPT